MIAFILRRLFQAVLVILCVGFIAFSMFTYVGDPISNMVGQDTTEAQREEIREMLGLNDPFYIQYAKYLGRLAHGEFGTSFRVGVAVQELIIGRLPATLELAGAAGLFAFFVGVPLGVYTGLHRTAGFPEFF